MRVLIHAHALSRLLGLGPSPGSHGIAEGTILSRLRILYVPVTHEQRLILVPALHILV
jgi:hypothetical protein